MYKIISLLYCSFFSVKNFAQANTPFTSCPNVSIAIARSGGNAYANEAVSMYHINPTTGVSSLITGGPLKDPANPTVNMDLNGAGINKTDGYLYGLKPGAAPTCSFYRIGSNYSIEQVGILSGPIPASIENSSIVNSAAGEFDRMDNFYITAVTGTFAGVTYTPSSFFIGKLANVSHLPAGAGALSPAYTQINFPATGCPEYLSTITGTFPLTSAHNTGLRDLAYNAFDGNLYTYVTFEYPAASGNFKGQILKINPLTGNVDCYQSSVLSFANTTNVISGSMINAAGDLLLLFTNGDLYKANVSTPGVYTGTISLFQAASVPGPIRGDLASCGAGVILPVKFENFTANSNKCAINFQWTVAQEQNVQGYELEIMTKDGTFTARKYVPATNSPLSHTYSTTLSEGTNSITARVKQIDYSGQFSFSKVLRIATSCANVKAIHLTNNGNLNNSLQIGFINCTPNEVVSLSVFRTDGALMLQQKIAAADMKIVDIQMLSKGIYYVRATFYDGTEGHQSFYKN